jgi:AcrR family transcriptional regulator
VPVARPAAFIQRESDILAAAVRLFEIDDWQSVTIEQIARAVDIGKGTIYKHFASKDELLARLALDFQRSLLDELAQLPVERPLEARLRALLEVWRRRHAGPPGLVRVVDYCDRPAFRALVSPETQRAFARLDAAFADLVARQVNADTRDAAEGPIRLVGAHAVLLGVLRTAARLEAGPGSPCPMPGDAAEAAVAFLSRALSPRPALGA